MAERDRLDTVMVTRGLAETRARARDAILRGTVSIDGQVVAKPGQKIALDAQITAGDPAAGYVSRAALKIRHALEVFAIDVVGQTALDLGASTGGFTQVLLEEGAARVHAVDVGRDQLHPRLSADPRVNRRDGVNARVLTLDDLEGERPGIVVSDMSFISLRLALPPALDLAASGAHGVFLVKPQFEIGREGVGKKGLVEPKAAERTARDLADWFDARPGWSATGFEPSPITGGDGNREWLLAGRKDG
ncbi:TlyA family RNA methyltransferase [Stappia sp. ES.058]|uniref:TlyA family RNA methyltransferase n=1 Tax=Stappia sp. ES.058 TaxID=1881061 RepID=UPI00087C85E1|nr:TlyA family RNA methyltransferase [Stappia sp. ES.058]SDT93088.1 23S rRNA (cytidine1920-2'-O)/16S rRNA (cytidine1409-2'-O)-methyltransferase [Stappia sp. ES.058]